MTQTKQPPTNPARFTTLKVLSGSSTHSCHSADTAARKGLPQGSLGSSLIMSRAVLAPLLNATSFADRLVLYGDDIAVAAKSEADAEDTKLALDSMLENSPVGPLTIGRHAIRHKAQRINFGKYGIKQDSWNPQSPMKACPSARSFDRFSERAEAKYLCGPEEDADDRVDMYRDVWPKSFPLWKPTEAALELLWLTTIEASQNAERSQK